MNTLLRPLFVLLLAVASLSSCKKEEPSFNTAPKSVIVFDDNVDKTTGDYRKGDNLILKVGVTGAATSVRIASTYSVAGAARRVELGPFAVNGGVATVNISAANLRAVADGPIPGAGTTAASRAANTYVLLVDAIAPDGSSERRFFNAVILL